MLREKIDDEKKINWNVPCHGVQEVKIENKIETKI
jgi:hypothetical protein